MTDKATTTPAPAAETKPDPTLQPRQILVWVVSVVLAFISAGLILQVIVPAIWPNNGRIPLNATIPISFLDLPLLPLILIPLTLFFVIWVDYFFHAHVVND
ncbi:MAG: hypothetical protein ACYDBJ_23935 [Aggregatilineales bacterium]